jgi:hypothetical protein
MYELASLVEKQKKGTLTRGDMSPLGVPLSSSGSSVFNDIFFVGLGTKTNPYCPTSDEFAERIAHGDPAIAFRRMIIPVYAHHTEEKRYELIGTQPTIVKFSGQPTCYTADSNGALHLTSPLIVGYDPLLSQPVFAGTRDELNALLKTDFRPTTMICRPLDLSKDVASKLRAIISR